MSNNLIINRRNFLRTGALFLANASLLNKVSLAHSETFPLLIYAGNFIPEGASCKVVFVSDHHYWPGNSENWGGGTQMTRNTNERMTDLVETLNAEMPDISIHGGDVISAGGAFFPTREEYLKELDFEKRFLEELRHPAIPLLGNHETPEGHYENESQLQKWEEYFGNPYRAQDVKEWRLIVLNCLLPNAGGDGLSGNVFNNIFGIDQKQLEWLRRQLSEASAQNLKVLLFAHVPPVEYENVSELEEVISGARCVKGMLCGHWHKNYLSMFGGIPVMVRISNAASPLGYTALHLYPDGKIIVVQKSQNFPFEDFVSSRIEGTAQGMEQDRYFTLGGSSQMPLSNLKLIGAETKARIADGHLNLTSRKGTGILLIDSDDLHNARFTMNITKARGARMGAVVLTKPDGSEGIETALTATTSPDGQMYLAGRKLSSKEVLDRSWFNVADDIVYRLNLEIRDNLMTVNWKNMPQLSASIDRNTAGKFGLFVENGAVYVTDLKLEKL